MKNNAIKIKLGLMVLAVALAFIILTGAMQNNAPSQVGRYRLSVINRGSFIDLYVIDTTTGVVKWVGDDQGKPFEAMKGI